MAFMPGDHFCGGITLTFLASGSCEYGFGVGQSLPAGWMAFAFFALAHSSDDNIGP